MHNALAGSVSGGDFGQVHSLKATRERTGVFRPLKKAPFGETGSSSKNQLSDVTNISFVGG